MQQKPTIETVAKKAGVAPSTVSRYFNGHYVSKRTKARLSEVVAELGYSRSWTARNLSLGRRGCIGVAVDSSHDLWFTELLVGLEEGLSKHEMTLALNSLELGGRYDSAGVLRWIRERQVDGLVIAKSQRRERLLLSAAIDTRLPIVLVAPDEAIAQAHVVRCDNYAAGRAVADHLYILGHRKLAFVGGPQHSVDSKHRLQGFRDGLAERGVSIKPADTFSCESYEAEAGITFAREFLAKPLLVTAIVMGNDALALGFMRVAQQSGISIPKTISIIGFDNIPEGALWWPGLTTVAQPMREMGQSACRILCEAIEAERQPNRTQRARELIEFPMTLTVRESTGPPRLNI